MIAKNRKLREDIAEKVFNAMVEASQCERAPENIRYVRGGSSLKDLQAQRVSQSILNLVESHLEEQEILFDEP